MAHILIMPRQGNTVESCIIVDWKIKEGDQVAAETMICEVETDKATFEIPAGAAGTVLKILYNAGDDVPVLMPIAVIGKAGEDWQAVLNGATPKDVSHGGTKPTDNTSDVSNSEKKECTILHSSSPSVLPCEINSEKTISPRARNLAEKEALPLGMASGTGPEGRIIERDVLTAIKNRPALTAAAKAAGTETIPQQGTGLGGRVTVSDLAQQTSLPITFHSEGNVTETPIKGIRKIISDRMFKSLAESAQFTLNSSAPVSRLQDIRSRMKTFDEIKYSKITVNDLILFAVSRILPQYPFMNAHKIGDTIKTFERVHMGVAVDTPRGLMVPVIRNANLLSLVQISSETKRLAAACQNSSVRPDELSDSTFTVTNLGSLGVTSFTPVINIPEVAILGVCSIEMKPVLNPSNECRFEPHIGFSLTINHQVVDGAPAARFLKALNEAIANIDLLLEAS